MNIFREFFKGLNGPVKSEPVRPSGRTRFRPGLETLGGRVMLSQVIPIVADVASPPSVVGPAITQPSALVPLQVSYQTNQCDSASNPSPSTVILSNPVTATPTGPVEPKDQVEVELD
jgi:hypothetical protein